MPVSITWCKHLHALIVRLARLCRDCIVVRAAEGRLRCRHGGRNSCLVIAGALAAASLNGAAAFAESVTMKSFGLIGTWSTDCARISGSFRLTYSAGDFFSGPIVRREIYVNDVLLTYDYQITAEEIVTANRIKYTQTPIKDPSTAHLNNELPSNVVMEKIENKIRERDRILSNGTLVTQDGVGIFRLSGVQIRTPEPWLARCAG
jgi:hypothetical protein